MLQTDIFVVDDERVIGETLGIILRQAGYRTKVFADPHAALLRIGEPPRLVLSDQTMPGMTGCAMASLFVQASPTIGVLLFSAELTETDLEWQFIHHQTRRSRQLRKPLHPSLLLHAVQELLASPVSLPLCPLFVSGTNSIPLTCPIG